MTDIFVKGLAESTAEVQAEFFNKFSHYIKVICAGKHETQLCYLADYLDSNGREFFESMDKFSKLSLEAKGRAENDINDLYRQRREIEQEIENLKRQKAELETTQ